MVQNMEYISQTINDANFGDVPPEQQLIPNQSMSRLPPCQNLLWYSWILAESTRRTWLVASGIQGIYRIIQQEPFSCMGGVMFTSRKGFWEAPSALIWEKRCAEVYAGLTRIPEADELLTKVPPEELNEFAKVVLEMSFGVEQMERWGIDTMV
jgi:hypothetical protein